jgi:hypothetical protein
MVAKALAQSPGYTCGPEQEELYNHPDAWHFLDSGLAGDCITLCRLAVVTLNTLGINAVIDIAYPTADTIATTNTCVPISPTKSQTVVCKKTNCNHSYSVSVLLTYPGNKFEAFFIVYDPNIKGFTVYPANGIFTSSYLHLQVLQSVTEIQYWVVVYSGYLYYTDNTYTKSHVKCPKCYTPDIIDNETQLLPARPDESVNPTPDPKDF